MVIMIVRVVMVVMVIMVIIVIRTDSLSLLSTTFICLCSLHVLFSSSHANYFNIRSKLIKFWSKLIKSWSKLIKVRSKFIKIDLIVIKIDQIAQLPGHWQQWLPGLQGVQPGNKSMEFFSFFLLTSTFFAGSQFFSFLFLTSTFLAHRLFSFFPRRPRSRSCSGRSGFTMRITAASSTRTRWQTSWWWPPSSSWSWPVWASWWCGSMTSWWPPTSSSMTTPCSVQSSHVSPQIHNSKYLSQSLYKMLEGMGQRPSGDPKLRARFEKFKNISGSRKLSFQTHFIYIFSFSWSYCLSSVVSPVSPSYISLFVGQLKICLVPD